MFHTNRVPTLSSCHIIIRFLFPMDGFQLLTRQRILPSSLYRQEGLISRFHLPSHHGLRLIPRQSNQLSLDHPCFPLPSSTLRIMLSRSYSSSRLHRLLRFQFEVYFMQKSISSSMMDKDLPHYP